MDAVKQIFDFMLLRVQELFSTAITKWDIFGSFLVFSMLMRFVVYVWRKVLSK